MRSCYNAVCATRLSKQFSSKVTSGAYFILQTQRRFSSAPSLQSSFPSGFMAHIVIWEKELTSPD